ncbi:MAG: VOC family protein [Chitinophagales bacterium]|nr:VOC family protein [Chitinophagales bacterium]HMV14717.1 hypothetical protein [Chitinophagales bacterium]HMW12523.1 hypothetical protein [Chitinophagales bacterium]HMX60092.1 hypothetical protein [Chitinophagales bacterium]HMY23088.1 hypothetical protein [Chitinophagales bacterium]
MKVIHFEIPAKNPERLKHFYSKIFDWRFCQWKEAGFWYALTGSPSEFGIDGGIIDVKELDIPVNSMIAVENIDTTLHKIVEVGGKVAVPKFYEQGVGYLAYFNDLDGNIFGLREVNPNV